MNTQNFRQHFVATSSALLLAEVSQRVQAQGFDKVNTTVTNLNTMLVTISVAVVTIAIIWAGFKMIFQGARLADVANVLIGATLIGGAGANQDRKSTRLNSSHSDRSRMPSSA